VCRLLAERRRGPAGRGQGHHDGDQSHESLGPSGTARARSGATATGCGPPGRPDSADSIDVGASRSSPSITAENAGLAIPALDRSARSSFEQAGDSLQARRSGSRWAGCPASGSRLSRFTRDRQRGHTCHRLQRHDPVRAFCGHTQATAGEVARACAQVLRTVKVSKAG